MRRVREVALGQIAPPSGLAARIGLIRTTVYTHLPANAFLVLAAFMPSAPLAITCLLLRMAFSQMDVPARQSYVMAIVPPEERAAAASVTNVPRSLATALSPSLAGALLALSSFGWPLVPAAHSRSPTTCSCSRYSATRRHRRNRTVRPLDVVARAVIGW